MLQKSLQNQGGSLAVAFLPSGDVTALKETNIFQNGVLAWSAWLPY